MGINNIGIIIYSAIVFCCHSTYGQKTTEKKFIYGINGHPLTQEAYQKNFDLQVKLINELGCTFYRIDIPTDTQGNIKDEKTFFSIYSKAKKLKINILPVIGISENYNDISLPTIAYSRGLLYGLNFSKKYKNLFKYYEVGNEEARNLISAQVDGNRLEHYDEKKTSIILSYIKGICDGIKINTKFSKIIINENWVHYGFFTLLEKYKVNYNIIGYHGYSDMGDLYKANRDFGNVIDSLAKKFRKKIWVTEINVRNNVNENETKKWLNKNLLFLRKNRNVEAVFIYELFDQPAFSNKSSPYYNESEAKFGLLEWKNLYKKKSSFLFYQSFVRKN